MTLTIGSTLEKRYHIEKKLGEGGFGAVYQATDTRLSVRCAIKESFHTTEEAARQFRREAEMLAKLRHPNLPRVTDYFDTPNGLYLVMDFVEGYDLAVVFQRHGAPLPEEKVLTWIGQVCKALTYLHTHNPPIIHRDIKPQNIIITNDGIAMLVDFGLAKIYESGMKTSTGARGGTPGFSPLEQYGVGSTDQRTDIYALGATLYFLLTGELPLESIERVANDAALKSPREFNPQISEPVEKAIIHALAIQPKSRPQNIEEFASKINNSSVTAQNIKGNVAVSTNITPQISEAVEKAMLRALAIQPKSRPQSVNEFTSNIIGKPSLLVSIYSANKGSGKSIVTANLAAQAAMANKRVAIMETDFQSPGIHVLFGLDKSSIKQSLNDYLHGKCAITDAAFLVGRGSNPQPGTAQLAGKSLWLVPSSIDTGEISRLIHDGYDFNVLNKGIKTLRQELKLDYLFIDTHSGLDDTTLLSIGISDELVIILRPDQRDFQGTAVMLDVSRRLDMPMINLLVNKSLTKYDSSQISAEVESKFQAPVAGVLPLSEDMIELGDADIFSLRFPNHPWSQELRSAAKIILNLS